MLIVGLESWIFESWLCDALWSVCARRCATWSHWAPRPCWARTMKSIPRPPQLSQVHAVHAFVECLTFGYWQYWVILCLWSAPRPWILQRNKPWQQEEQRTKSDVWSAHKSQQSHNSIQEFKAPMILSSESNCDSSFSPSRFCFVPALYQQLQKVNWYWHATLRFWKTPLTGSYFSLHSYLPDSNPRNNLKFTFLYLLVMCVDAQYCAVGILTTSVGILGYCRMIPFAKLYTGNKA